MRAVRKVDELWVWRLMIGSRESRVDRMAKMWEGF